MPRRLGPLLLLALVGLGAGLVVARVPGDPEASVVTRRHHGADPLLSAVLLRFAASSLLTSPARYFSPPILYPDPNPLRGTEPLVAEALLALPFRAVLGDRPALVYTCVKVATLALVALATGLLLRELGVRLSLCLLAGGLSVLSATTTVFADRLQALSLQWLPLALVFALRFWRSGGAVHAAGFGACLFLHIQASLYTAVMLLGVAPFLVPLLRPLVAAAAARQRLPGLAAAASAAAFLCLLVLWPYAADRADVAAYSTAGYAADKNWNAIALTYPLTSPPEYPPEWASLGPRDLVGRRLSRHGLPPVRRVRRRAGAHRPRTRGCAPSPPRLRSAGWCCCWACSCSRPPSRSRWARARQPGRWPPRRSGARSPHGACGCCAGRSPAATTAG